MGKKKVEHVVFDGMRQIKKKVNISKYNQNTQKNFLRKNPLQSEVFTAYQKRIDDIQKRIAEKKGTDVTSFEVRQLIGEYDFVAKQLYQVKDAQPLLMDIAKGYQESEELIAGLDSVYGSGTAKYIGEAIASFYTSPSKIGQ